MVGSEGPGLSGAALGVAGIALGGFSLGEDDDVTGVGQRQRRAKAGDTAADDQEVAAEVHDAILSILP